MDLFTPAQSPVGSTALAPGLEREPARGGAAADLRGQHRVPVRLRVSRHGRSAPLGRTRDLSLDGVFVETPEPFEVGAVVPLALELAPGEAPLVVTAEVVRRPPEGMALRFVGFDRAGQRRLKRWIVDFTSVQGARRQVAQLHDAGRRVEPLRAPARVRALFESLQRDGARVTLIPIEREARDYVGVAAMDASEIRFVAVDRSTLAPGEEVFGLVTSGFVSWSFTARVLAVRGAEVDCSVPDRVVYSERRSAARDPAPPGAVVRWPAPWQPGAWVSHPLLERGADGLSFTLPADACLVVPGAPLPDAELLLEGRAEPLTAAEVRHITELGVGEDGRMWLCVGVSHGAPHRPLDLTERSLRPAVPKRGAIAWLARRLARVKTIISYGYHQGRRRVGRAVATSRLVRFPRAAHQIVGLLDRSFELEERVRCPLVIVVPGFAGRKEQMGALAHTLVEGFHRQHRDIAVLRFDGTNNLGESSKDPGCTGEGREALHYTLSGVTEDTLAALRWARQNPWVEPTHLVLVSVSMASVGVREALCRPEAADVGLWVSYMGAADAIDAVRNVSGNIDLHAYWARGERLGVVSLSGVLTDGDHFWADLAAHGTGELDEARAQMGRIRADVVWLRGVHDAWMDPRRVRELVSAAAPGRRELIEVDSGHVPRTGDEAIAQFVRITQRVWQHVHGDQLPPFRPSMGRLEVARQAEWERVRRARPRDTRAWWRDYLLGAGGLGFDILEYSPHYSHFMDRQAETLIPAGAPAARVLDLGAGTGNLSVRLLARGAGHVIAADLVPEALARLRAKVGPDPRLELFRVDLEGSPRVLLRRLAAGDLLDPGQLAARLPGVQRDALERLLGCRSEDVRAALLGRPVDPAAAAEEAHLPAHAAALLSDLHHLVVAAGAPRAASPPHLAVLSADALHGGDGLPFPDASFDAIGLSLLLSYLQHPDDVLYECWRVLRPGGRLVISSMIEDSDSSKLYLELVRSLETLPEHALDATVSRDTLLGAARMFVDHAAELYRWEEEGLFKFYSPSTLIPLLQRRGFVSPRAERAFGSPPQAVIVSCLKP